jgi:hypothetical protein
VLVAALDCDNIAARAAHKGGAPVTLSTSAKRRECNFDGAADRTAEAIRRGFRP